MLMTDYEVVADGGRKHRWSSSENLRTVKEMQAATTSIPVVARRTGCVVGGDFCWKCHPPINGRWPEFMPVRGPDQKNMKTV